MSSPIGKFLNMAMTTGLLPKDAMAEAMPAVGNYLTQWFRARKFATKLHGQERELAMMLVESDNQLLLVPCILQENEEGKDVINRQLTAQGVNLTGMLHDVPLLEIITSAINDGDPIKTMQRLQDLLADAVDQNRLLEESTEDHDHPGAEFHEHPHGHRTHAIMQHVDDDDELTEEDQDEEDERE